jgi:hypothetical protein
VGKTFCSRQRFGVRVLILGVSHYFPNIKDKKPGFTKQVIRKIAKEEDKKPFCTKLLRSFDLQGLPSATPREFWDCVAFYNYIQESVGSGPRKAPTDEMRKRAEDPFREVVTCLKPDLIVVCGDRLWKWLPSGGKEWGKPGRAVTVGGKKLETWLYPTGRGQFALTSWIVHPAGRGFRYQDSRKRIRSLLRETRLKMRHRR